MNPDLLPLRRRWWGFYAIAPALALAVFVLGRVALQAFDAHDTQRAAVALVVAACAALALAAFYAPWTFHWATRLIGGAIFAGYALYLVDEIALGRWHGGWSSVFSAARGVLVFGLGGLALLLRRRAEVCPYAADGSFVGSSIVHVVQLERMPVDDRACTDALRAIIVDLKADVPRLDVDIANDEDDDVVPRALVVTVPRSAGGDAMWAQAQGALGARGVAYHVASDSLRRDLPVDA